MNDRSESSHNRVAFCISPELMDRAEEALAAVRGDPGDRSQIKELIEVILELTEGGMDYYFLEPLRRAEVGTMTSAAARLGIAAAGRGIPAIVRRVVSSLDEEQVLAIADFIDEILIRERAGG